MFFQLEAAIVRIMKSKKSLSHGDLMKELFQQVKFPLDVSVIDYVWGDQLLTSCLFRQPI